MFGRNKKNQVMQNPPTIHDPFLDNVKQEQPREAIDLKGDISAADLRKIVDAYHQSAVIHPLTNLDHIASSNVKLQEWEIKMAKETFQKFLAKYDSPLAKALK